MLIQEDDVCRIVNVMYSFIYQCFPGIIHYMLPLVQRIFAQKWADPQSKTKSCDDV